MGEICNKNNCKNKKSFFTYMTQSYPVIVTWQLHSNYISHFGSSSTTNQFDKIEFTRDSELFHLHLIFGDSMYVDELPP